MRKGIEPRPSPLSLRQLPWLVTAAPRLKLSGLWSARSQRGGRIESRAAVWRDTLTLTHTHTHTVFFVDS